MSTVIDEIANLSALKKAEKLVNRSRTSEGFLRFEVSSPETIEKALKVADLTAEDAKPHIINIIQKKISENIARLEMGGTRTIRGNPIVSVADNYDNLLFPYDNAGRSSTYTRYVDEDHVLRTHTSALVPSTFRDFYKEFNGDIPDTVFLFPGLVYRRDVIDPKHLDVFHQLDVWTLKKNNGREPADRKDLLRLVDAIFGSIFSDGTKPIVLEAVHPYTMSGIEVYAKSDESEIEVLEAGLAHPQVLKNAGFNPEKYSGLALGMGLDRLVMSLKHLSNIRYIRSTEPRISRQMLNLERFKEVSSQPPISRDMSYCVPENYTEEDVCEEIKDAFGDNAYLIENVYITERTKCNDLNLIAKEKLGAAEGQDNVLVKIVLRHPDKTLTKDEANKLYDQAYPKLNKGSKGYI